MLKRRVNNCSLNNKRGNICDARKFNFTPLFFVDCVKKGIFQGCPKSWKQCQKERQRRMDGEMGKKLTQSRRIENLKIQFFLKRWAQLIQQRIKMNENSPEIADGTTHKMYINLFLTWLYNKSQFVFGEVLCKRR